MSSSSVEVMRVIDKVNKISRTEFIAELKKLGMNTDQIDLLNQRRVLRSLSRLYRSCVIWEF